MLAIFFAVRPENILTLSQTHIWCVRDNAIGRETMTGYQVDVERDGNEFVVAVRGLLKPLAQRRHETRAKALQYARRAAEHYGLWVHDYTDPRPNGEPRVY